MTECLRLRHRASDTIKAATSVIHPLIQAKRMLQNAYQFKPNVSWRKSHLASFTKLCSEEDFQDICAGLQREHKQVKTTKNVSLGLPQLCPAEDLVSMTSRLDDELEIKHFVKTEANAQLAGNALLSTDKSETRSKSGC